MSFTIALFGEAEKGEYQTPYFFQNLPQLVDLLGNPPPNSHGLYWAIQALLYHYQLLFFRVEEEGFSYNDYLDGLIVLQTEHSKEHIKALCLPGVGDKGLIHALSPFCVIHHALLITSEADLYDYLTSLK
jgi:hypothetical protein